MVAAQIDISEDRIADFCRRWKVQEFALFGSVLRDDFGPKSDVDVLYTLAPGTEEDWDSYWAMKTELEGIFGREVDLVKKGTIENPFRRAHIMKNMRVIHAA